MVHVYTYYAMHRFLLFSFTAVHDCIVETPHQPLTSGHHPYVRLHWVLIGRYCVISCCLYSYVYYTYTTRFFHVCCDAIRDTANDEHRQWRRYGTRDHVSSLFYLAPFHPSFEIKSCRPRHMDTAAICCGWGRLFNAAWAKILGSWLRIAVSSLCSREDWMIWIQKYWIMTSVNMRYVDFSIIYWTCITLAVRRLWPQ